MHTHLREPGQEAKEDFHSGTQAAAAGGFTRIATMANTKPVVDNAALVRGLQKQAELTGLVKVEFIGAVSKNLEGKELAEMGDMAEAVWWASPMTVTMWKAPLSCAALWNTPACSTNRLSTMPKK